MTTMFGLADKCPFHKLSAVYCRRLYGKDYMNSWYAHKAMYPKRYDGYMQELVVEAKIMEKIKLALF